MDQWQEFVEYVINDQEKALYLETKLGFMLRRREAGPYSPAQWYRYQDGQSFRATQSEAKMWILLMESVKRYGSL